jgi:hypothetical protein
LGERSGSLSSTQYPSGPIRVPSPHIS